MKILKIAFQNINSLKGVHEIDFSKSPFTTSSLFAITGPTGSGKSSILDVISLGLFSQVPRLGKITKNDVFAKGAILTRNQKEAFARITYSCKSGIYESVWAISTNRRGNLRDYEMQLLNADTGEALDLKKSEVPGKNEELIGLNYSQFIKSVLLAQGEFAQFLKARKDERAALLEKITGTGIYRHLGLLSYDKHKEVTAAIQKQEHELEILLQNALEVEEIEKYNKELTEKSGLCTQTEGKLDVLKKQLELKKDIGVRLKEIQSLELSIKEAATAITRFEAAHGKPLRAHEEVRHCAEELRGWKLLQANLDELQKSLQENEKTEQANLQAIADCLKSTSKLTGLESTTDTISGNLKDFADKVSRLQQLQKTKRTDYSYLRKQLITTLDGLPFELDPNTPEAGRNELQQLQKRSEGRIDSLKTTLSSLNLDQLDQEKQRVRALYAKGRVAVEKHQELTRLEKEATALGSKLGEVKEQINPLPTRIKSLDDQILLEEKELEILTLKKDNELLHARMEDLRVKLKEGEPCPLCGAKEHPYAAEGPAKEGGLETALRDKEMLLRNLRHQLSSDKATFKNYTEQLKSLEQQQETRHEELNNNRDTFNTEFTSLQRERKITDWRVWCDEQEAQLVALEDYEKELHKLSKVQKALPLHKELNEVFEEGMKVTKELGKLYSGNDVHEDCSKLKDDWVRISNTLENLQERKKNLRETLEAKKEAITNLEKKLGDLLSETSFLTIQSAVRALLPDPEVHKLQTERDGLRDRKKHFENSRDVLSRQLIRLQEKEIEKRQEDLEGELRENLQSLSTLRERCEDLRRRLKNEEDRQVEVKALKEQIAESENSTKRWRLLKELIGDATGKKFNDFAQDLSLTQLLQLANHRLLDLSDRYQLDKPTDDEDDGLIAIDEHMGGQRRSVKTLSGGETFLLSLAMALALSDLASRNVEIDSLFIDEGFGTLDPETLDQTLDTLEKLQAESAKTIGIISHVESLKDRISTQVRLERNGQGYSQLSIVP